MFEDEEFVCFLDIYSCLQDTALYDIFEIMMKFLTANFAFWG